ncbi:Gamma-tubulin complex component 5 [Nowakowskiella sp. JEL0407]|nr:Gamma-tubulin complex component 5 [Nowakowskiella sp. JEL0407]
MSQGRENLVTKLVQIYLSDSTQSSNDFIIQTRVNKILQSFRFGKLGGSNTGGGIGSSYQDVLSEYDGIVHKFYIHGKDLKANNLEMLVNWLKFEFGKNKSANDDKLSIYAISDVLKLLLLLSNAPVNHTYSTPLLTNTSDVDRFISSKLNNEIFLESSPLTWNEIMQEDPPRGDHWRTIFNYDKNDAADERATKLEDDAFLNSNTYPTRWRDFGRVETDVLVEDFEDESEDDDLVNDIRETSEDKEDVPHYYENREMNCGSLTDPLLNVKYWKGESFSTFVQLEGILEEIANGNPGVAAHRINDPRYITAVKNLPNYVPEMVIIKEILLMFGATRRTDDADLRVDIGDLSNWETGTLFAYDANTNQFKTNKSFAMTHLTDEALQNLLATFNQSGLALLRLRESEYQIKRNAMLPATAIPPSKTLQKFASAIDQFILTPFDGVLQFWERFYQKCESGEGLPDIATVIDFRERIKPWMEMFCEIDRRLVSGPRGIMNLLKNKILTGKSNRIDIIKNYPESLCTFQISGSDILLSDGDELLSANPTIATSKSIFTTMYVIFEKISKPCFENIESWIVRGEILENGRISDFFVIKNDKVDKRSMSYWDAKYSIRKSNNVPLYPNFLERSAHLILSTGKANNLVGLMGGSELILKVIQNYKSIDSSKRSLHARFFGALRKYFLQSSTRSHAVNLELEEEEPAIVFASQSTTPEPPKSEILQDTSPEKISFNEFDLESAYPGALKLHLEEVVIDTEDQKKVTAKAPVSVQLWRSLQDCVDDAFHETLQPIYTYVGHQLASVLFRRKNRTLRWTMGSDGALLSDLKGLQGVYFMLDGLLMDTFSKKVYKLVRWPFNIIVSPSNTAQLYNHVASLLLQIKVSQNALTERYTFWKGTKRSSQTDIVKKRACVRLKLDHFVQSLHNHLMTSVIHVESIKFLNEISGLIDVDEMIEAHQRFVICVRDRCLLHEKTKPILNDISEILKMCLQFEKVCHGYDQAIFDAESLGISKIATSKPQNKKGKNVQPIEPTENFDNLSDDDERWVGRNAKDDAIYRAQRAEEVLEKTMKEIVEELENRRRFIVASLNALASHGANHCQYTRLFLFFSLISNSIYFS